MNGLIIKDKVWFVPVNGFKKNVEIKRSTMGQALEKNSYEIMVN